MYKSIAKINLFLEVTGKLDNGYHTIETLFYPLNNIADKIEYIETENEGIQLFSKSEGFPLDKTNLCWQAVNEYAKCADISLNCNITVEKNIPIAAGLGGGSSNAATILNILQKKYNRISYSKLLEIAKKLGADVPFFLNPQPAIANGIGEGVSKIDFSFPKLHILCINPKFPVSAAWGYKNYTKIATCATLDNLLLGLKNNDIAQIAKNIHNDLESGLLRKFPVIQMLKDFAEKNGAMRAIISGSGPTIFAICATESKKEDLEIVLKNKYNHLIVL